MKKAAAFILSGVILISFISCFAQTAGETEQAEELVVGGWEIYGNGQTVLPEEVQTAFEKATDGFTESKLTPVAFVGEQVVAGMNYRLLCHCEPSAAGSAAFRLITIYADLEGNAEITETEDFPFWEMTWNASGDLEESSERLAGGWAIPEMITPAVLPEEVQTAFDKASETLTGAGFTPMAYLGKQIVAGTNYAILCRCEGSALELGVSLGVIVIYVDPEGSASIKS